MQCAQCRLIVAIWKEYETNIVESLIKVKQNFYTLLYI